MASVRPTYYLRPSGLESSAGTDPSLAERLAVFADDRASTADALVREVCEVLIDWLRARPAEWTWLDARTMLAADSVDRATGLAAFRAAHAWRGPVAGWLHTLDGMVESALHRDVVVPARELIAEELGLWLDGEDGTRDGTRDGALGSSDLSDPVGASLHTDLPWSGEPLAAGRRIPNRDACVESFLDDIERGEVLLVQGYSDTVVRAIEAVAERGLSPEVVLTEGGPDLGGRRMARRLSVCGAKLRLIYDAALCGAVARADRVWLGTEAIGAQAVALRVGSGALLEEARRQDVPCTIFATTDKLVPGGDLQLPGWAEHDQWLLWESAPDGVRLDSQAFERVPLDLCDLFATEHGAMNIAELSLRALRTH